MNELALFAGVGGGILGGHLLGWRTVCAVENNAYAASVLVARQNDKTLPPFPIWDDVCTFDGKPWRGRVDVVSGGFPCQDLSAIGKGAGLDGARSGLWREMARIVDEVRPKFVFVENSPLLVQRGLSVVLKNLAEIGYDARWTIIGADDAGFPHHRKRFWLLGYPIGTGLERHSGDVQKTGGDSASVGSTTPPGLRFSGWQRAVSFPDNPTTGNPEYQFCWIEKQLWARRKTRFVEPSVGRVAHGVAHRMDRLTAIGNGQVPAVVKLAWEFLNEKN